MLDDDANGFLQGKGFSLQLISKESGFGMELSVSQGHRSIDYRDGLRISEHLLIEKLAKARILSHN
jgi:hypothetical protein